MSQVVVCQDSFGSKRTESLKQEKKITLNEDFSQWQRSDATKTLLIERLIVILFAPVVLFWSLLLFSAGASLAFSLLLFKVLGNIAGFLKRIVT
jgi:hypothetical protein